MNPADFPDCTLVEWGRDPNGELPLTLTGKSTKLHKSHMKEKSKINQSKRDFVKKLALGTAFTVPILKSFSMDSVKAKSLYSAKGTF